MLSCGLTGGLVLQMEAACITITNQPKNMYVFPYCPVTFSVGAQSALPMSFQWFRNVGLGSEPIPGATNSTVTIFAEWGGYSAVVYSDCGSTRSREAILSLSGDVIPPRLAGASGLANLNQVVVSFLVGHCASPFNVLYPENATNIANDQLSGGLIVSNAQLSCTGTNVILSTSRQTPSTSYTVTVSGVLDVFGNGIYDGSQTTFTALAQAVVPPYVVRLVLANGVMVVAWAGDGILQVAARPDGPWSDIIGASSPYLPNLMPPCLSGASVPSSQFFRARWLLPGTVMSSSPLSVP
jgi:hypothetical protein